jgi:AcrR family transcriptional regulator
MRKTGRPLSFDRSVALDAAMDAFWRYGYEGASVSILTTAMGITPPSLYTAFGDKQRLYLEALDRYMHRPGLDLELLLDRNPTAFDAVKSMLTSASKQQTRPGQPRGCMLMNARVSTPAESSMEKDVIQLRKIVLKMIEKRIERGIQEGDVPDTVNSVDLASFYVMVLQGMSVQARDGAGPKDLLKLANHSLLCWPK